MKLNLYGAKWCGFCRTLQQALDNEQIDYTYLDVDDKDNETSMLKATDGKYLIPTVTFGDRFLQNPSLQAVKELISERS